MWGLALLVGMLAVAGQERLPRLAILVNPAPRGMHQAAIDGAPLIDGDRIDIDGDPAAANNLHPTAALAVTIIGPRDVIVGDPVHLVAETTGEVSGIDWSIDGERSGLAMLDGGRRAMYTSRDLGDYTVVVGVAGNGGQAAVATHTFAILAQPALQPLTLASIDDVREEFDYAEFVRGLVASVRGGDTASEALVLAGTLRSEAGVLRSGGASAEDDPLFLVEQAAEEALGPAAFRRWEADFFAPLRELLAELMAKGHIDGLTGWANAWDNTASVLEVIGDR